MESTSVATIQVLCKIGFGTNRCYSQNNNYATNIFHSPLSYLHRHHLLLLLILLLLLLLLLLLCTIFQLVNSINKFTMLQSIEDLRKIIKKLKIGRMNMQHNVYI